MTNPECAPSAVCISIILCVRALGCRFASGAKNAVDQTTMMPPTTTELGLRYLSIFWLLPPSSRAPREGSAGMRRNQLHSRMPNPNG